MREPKVEVLRATAAELGEGPTWDASSSTLIWVDILAGRVWRESMHDPAAARSVCVESHVGAAMPSAVPGELLLLLRDGFYILGVDDRVQALARPLADMPQLRFNDGRVDPWGRAFGGSMPYTSGSAEAALYRLDSADSTGYAARQCVPDLRLQLSNGMGWSPDGRRMYLVDTAPGVVWTFDYDGDQGDMATPEVFVRVPPGHGGAPDGLTVDDDGCVWVAMWGGSAVHRYTPRGDLDRVVHLPVSQPTSMCFAGDDLSTLVITTASYGLDEAARAREPLAGSLFAIDPACTGPAATPWQG